MFLPAFRNSLLLILAVAVPALTAVPTSAGGGESGTEPDQQLIARIAQGHARLAKRTSDLTGTIEHLRGPRDPLPTDLFSRDGLELRNRIRFFQSGEKLRLEYHYGRVFPGFTQPPDRINEIMIQTPDVLYRYLPSASTGVPVATVERYEKPDSGNSPARRVRSDVLGTERILFELGNKRILNLLQRPGVMVKTGKYADLDEALIVSQTSREYGFTTNLTLVLDPRMDYALRHSRAVSHAGATTMEVAVHTRVTKLPDGTILPSEVVRVTTSTKSGTVDPKGSFRDLKILTVDSQEPVDPKLFTLQSFADMGIDYNIVETAPDGSQRIVEQAHIPGGRARLADGTPVHPTADLRSGRSRLPLLLIANAVFLLLVAGVVFYIRWRRRSAVRGSD